MKCLRLFYWVVVPLLLSCSKEPSYILSQDEKDVFPSRYYSVDTLEIIDSSASFIDTLNYYGSQVQDYVVREHMMFPDPSYEHLIKQFTGEKYGRYSLEFTKQDDNNPKSNTTILYVSAYNTNFPVFPRGTCRVSEIVKTDKDQRLIINDDLNKTKYEMIYSIKDGVREISKYDTMGIRTNSFIFSLK